MTTKTMSIRMDRETFEFLNELTKEQRSDLSKSVREMVTRGRVLLGVERYRRRLSARPRSDPKSVVKVFASRDPLSQTDLNADPRQPLIEG